MTNKLIWSEVTGHENCSHCGAGYLPIIFAQFGDNVIEGCANCEKPFDL